MCYDDVKDKGHDYRHVFGFLVSRATDWRDVLGCQGGSIGVPEFQREAASIIALSGDLDFHTLVSNLESLASSQSISQ